MTTDRAHNLITLFALVLLTAGACAAWGIGYGGLILGGLLLAGVIYARTRA